MPTADLLFINLLNSGVLEEQTKKLEALSFSWLAAQKLALAKYRNDAARAAQADSRELNAGNRSPVHLCT